MQAAPTIEMNVVSIEDIEDLLDNSTEAKQVNILESITFTTYPDVLLTMTDGVQYKGFMNKRTREKFDFIVDFPHCVIDFPYCMLSGFDDNNNCVECAVYLVNY